MSLKSAGKTLLITQQPDSGLSKTASNNGVLPTLLNVVKNSIVTLGCRLIQA